MKNWKFESVVLLFFILLLQMHLTAQSIQVQGRISGYDGLPLPLAHVQVAPLGFGIFPKEPIAFSEASPDGTYHLAIEDAGVYLLIFSGVHHKPYFMYLHSPEGGMHEIDIQLGTHQYVEDGKWLGVIGHFNEFDYMVKSPMVAETGGKFRTGIKSEEKTEQLYLLGAANGTAIAFPASKYTWRRHEKISSGGYVGLVSLEEEDSLSLRYDPTQLPPAGRQAVVKFSDPKVEKMAQVYRRALARQDEFFRAVSAYQQEHEGDMDGFQFDFSDFFAEIRQQIALENDVDVRGLLYVTYGWLGRFRKEKLDSTVAREALQTLTPSSPAWGVEHYAVMEFVNAAGGLENNEAYIDYLHRMVVEQPMRSTQAWMLYNLVGFYKETDDQKYDLCFQQLERDYGSSYAAQYAQKRHRKNRNVAVGKPVPDFALSDVLQPDQLVKNEDLKGKLYLMDFWATWCGPCLGELPNLKRVYDTFPRERFEILSVSLDENIKTVRRFLDKGTYEMPWLNTHAGGDIKGEVASTFEILGIPAMVLVDERGMIVATGEELRGKRLAGTIEKFLAKNAGN